MCTLLYRYCFCSLYAKLVITHVSPVILVSVTVLLGGPVIPVLRVPLNSVVIVSPMFRVPAPPELCISLASVLCVPLASVVTVPRAIPLLPLSSKISPLVHIWLVVSVLSVSILASEKVEI